jgi:hypothetical protein
LPLRFQDYYSGKSDPAAAENRLLESSTTDTHRLKYTTKQTPIYIYIYAQTAIDVATLITTVQQIMTGLQTADTKQNRSAVIMRAVYGMVLRKKSHNQHYLIVQHTLTPLYVSDRAFSSRVGNSRDNYQTSHCRKLNLVMSPHSVRYHDHTGQLSE